jgi:acetyl esterase
MPPYFPPPKRSMEDAMLAHTRRALRLMLAIPQARAPGLAKIEDFDISGGEHALRARYYQAEDAGAGPLMLYFHGGGFVTCDIDTHDSVCSWLAKASGARLLSVGYRLAPETSFPGQIADARTACAWALKNAKRLGAAPRKLIMCGDSAGAWLAAMCALELNQSSPGVVPLQVLFYPLIHVEDSLWAEEEVRNFRFVGRLAVMHIAKSLGAERIPSLLDVDLSASPTTILAGGGALDPVRADVRSYAGALQATGVRVIEKKYPVLVHGGLNLTAFSKTAVAVLSDVGALVRAELTR